MNALGGRRDWCVALFEVARYTATMVLGLGVDVGIGYAANAFLEIPLVLAAAMGFSIAVSVNYLLFEYWVFGGRNPSWPRLGKAYMAAQGALCVRLATVWILQWASLGALVTLISAAGLSFAVNFVLARLFLKK